MKTVLSKYLIIGIGVLVLILLGDLCEELFAQPPSLPLPPSRPVPWGNPIIIAMVCMGYGALKMFLKKRI